MTHKQPKYIELIEITLLFYFLVLACGCTPTGSFTKTKPNNFNAKDYRTALIEVSSIENDSDTRTSINFFEDILFRKLKDKRIFAKVIKGSQSSNERPDLIIKAELLWTKHISRSLEFWFGSLAGRAKIIVNITMIDQNSAKNIAETRVSGESAGGSVFARATDEAFGQAADRVIEFIIAGST
ncbi:MAG: hypothetical protein HY892_02670 [Deltaproteobacteria bacterium]|nr:hypothetical protein [Deltaproteobacteria bacterium]